MISDSRRNVKFIRSETQKQLMFSILPLQIEATEYNFPAVLIQFRFSSDFQKYPNTCINHTSMWWTLQPPAF